LLLDRIARQRRGSAIQRVGVSRLIPKVVAAYRLRSGWQKPHASTQVCTSRSRASAYLRSCQQLPESAVPVDAVAVLNRTSIFPECNCQPWHAVDLFFDLQSESPENGSFLGFCRRLSGILMPKSSIVGLWRLFAMRKARIWRAFLTKERIFSENENAWLQREDSNLRMVESKSADDCQGIALHAATVLILAEVRWSDRGLRHHAPKNGRCPILARMCLWLPLAIRREEAH
jgi:hypothetical protein